MKPPSDLISYCEVSEPLDETLFRLRVLDYSDRLKSSEWEAAFIVQTEQWFKQTNNLAACNLKIKNLNEWFIKQAENLK